MIKLSTCSGTRSDGDSFGVLSKIVRITYATPFKEAVDYSAHVEGLKTSDRFSVRTFTSIHLLLSGGLWRIILCGKNYEMSN